jgi:hypothetical protein
VSAPSIIVDDSATDNGLAQMLADLLRQNLEQNPKKIRYFNKLGLSVAITAPDAEVQLTIFFNRGNCTIYDGVTGKPHLHIITDSANIMSLSAAPVRLGLPDPFESAGRDLIKKIFTGELKIRGMFRHPLAVTCLTNVFSVQ